MGPIKVCFCGLPKTGSWKIRALQMSQMRTTWSCRGSRLGTADILGHDVFCFVKRAELRTMDFLRRLGKVVVYDVLDCWMQLPRDYASRESVAQLRDYFRDYFHNFPADGVIFANRTMFEDLRDLVSNPTFIYHHYRPGLEPIGVKERPLLVGYEGQEAYLGPWREAVERACRTHGLTFVVNPPSYTDLDIGFAARGGEHAALINSRYKSNVKAANFYGAALPCLVHAEEVAYRETDCGYFRFFRTEDDLADALAELIPYATRLRTHQGLLQARGQFAIEHMASLYEAYFEEVVRATGRGGTRGKASVA